MTKTKEQKLSNKSLKKAKSIVSMFVGIMGLVLLIFLNRYIDNSSTKNDWSIKCQNKDRIYRLTSSKLTNSQNLTSHTNRKLGFLDENQKMLYSTHNFDHEALEKKGIWRFTYTKDPRLFGKKDPSKVLQGDEQIFEISSDLKTLNIITKDNKNIQLPCTTA